MLTDQNVLFTLRIKLRALHFVTVFILLTASGFCQFQPSGSDVHPDFLRCSACNAALLYPAEPSMPALAIEQLARPIVAANHAKGWHLRSSINFYDSTEPGKGDLLLDRLNPGALSANPALWTQNEKTQPQEKQKKKEYSPSATTGSPGHIFWIVPAYKVNYQGVFKPLTPREKFSEWARGSYDPLGLAAGAAEAAIEYSPKDGFCGYGKGIGGYGECFGSAELDANVSSFIGDFALAVVLHQDPRYFRLGEGGFPRRVWYAISRVFVTHSDSGRTVFYSSALSGTVIAAGLSNLYYPVQDRGLGLTLSRIGWDLGDTALYDGAAEFWPDIRRGLYRIF